MSFETSPRPAAITPRSRLLPPGIATRVDMRAEGRKMLRTTRAGVLSTLDPGSGYPYGSATNVATAQDGSPIFIAAMTALHTRNLVADPRIALTLVDLSRGDAMIQPRLTLLGLAGMVGDAEVEPVRRRYLARHRKATVYTTLPDARFFRMRITGVSMVGDLSKVTPDDLITDLTDAWPLIDAEAALVRGLNEAPDPAARRLALLAGGDPGRWRVTGIDPDGIDFIQGDATLRLTFTVRVTNPAGLSRALADMGA